MMRAWLSSSLAHLFPTKYREKQRLLRFLLVSVTAFFIFLIVAPRKPAVVRSRYLLSVDEALTSAISSALDEHATIHVGEGRQLKIRKVQDALACALDEGSWWQPPVASTVPIFTPEASCFITYMLPRYSMVDPLPRLCSLLSGKKILFVGPETTFYLHSLWLRALEAHENRTLSCLGPEFCTFHHICQAPNHFRQTSMLVPPERALKLPRDQDLASTGSAILRYIQSTSLRSSLDPASAGYTVPQVDAATGVRIRDTYWLSQARRSDIVVLHRGPTPAPAWTYDAGRAGNWSFVDALTAGSPYPRSTDASLSVDSTRRHHIVHAALHTTLTSFLPAVLETLRTVRADSTMSQRLFMWHEAWYIHPRCADPAIKIPDYANSLNALLHLQLSSKIPASDPWVFYYNAQVYMHKRILRDLLPRYGIVFVPQVVPIMPSGISLETQSMDSDATAAVFGKTTRRRGVGQPADCLRPDFVSASGRTAETVFMASIAVALEEMNSKLLSGVAVFDV